MSVGVFVGVDAGVLVTVPVGVLVTVPVGVLVTVPVGVLVTVSVGVLVTVPVGVLVTVPVGVLVTVPVGVLVAVAVGTLVRVAVKVGGQSAPLVQSWVVVDIKAQQLRMSSVAHGTGLPCPKQASAAVHCTTVELHWVCSGVPEQQHVQVTAAWP